MSSEMTRRFFLKTGSLVLAASAVRMGPVAISTLPVAALSVIDARLNAAIYSAKPSPPESKNSGISFLRGSPTLYFGAMAIKQSEAMV